MTHIRSIEREGGRKTSEEVARVGKLDTIRELSMAYLNDVTSVEGRERVCFGDKVND
jgi:hypothetical protein